MPIKPAVKPTRKKVVTEAQLAKLKDQVVIVLNDYASIREHLSAGTILELLERVLANVRVIVNGSRYGRRPARRA